jgi:phosphoribosylglycinamide formyltransferase 1
VLITGCTVHFVRVEMDAGPIVAQAAVTVLPGDTEATLAARVLEAEHKLYPHALRMVASGAARVVDEQVVFAPGLVAFQMPLVVPGLG